MNKENTQIGDQKLQYNDLPVSGEFITESGETFYKISNYDRMNPFLISVVSPSDHWLYISSNGGLTAGRKNPDNALFPYTNDDELHDVHSITGSKTIIKIFENGKTFLWEPFSNCLDGLYKIKRDLYKNISGTKIIFEEINEDLEFVFKYGWTTGDKLGFIKFSKILNISDRTRKIEVLDGIQNVLPSGIYQQLQTEFSTLIDGYKKNELIEESGIGVFSLSSIPSDRAQPSESLIATTVFSAGLNSDNTLLSVKQLDKFRKNLPLENEHGKKGMRGAYFICSKFELNAGQSNDWYIAAEVNQNAGDIVQLNKFIKDPGFKTQIENEIENTRKGLRKLVGQADGIQLSSNMLFSARHFSNVMFNIMRGGLFLDSYYIDKEDFISFVKEANPFVIDAHTEFFVRLPDRMLHSEIVNSVKEIGDPHFTRLALEYMPITFSRRHGDPSRPWNKFSIEIRNEKNEQVLNYQGNWRDIFQNWEALALSYPKFLESMISKFLNNSTADGYNPYRIFRDGFDWEELEPHNPWANIGYWGDHQIIYLLKLLELSKQFNPNELNEFVEMKIFSFANVPYRIKMYSAILQNPRDTIEFDAVMDRRLRSEAEKYGWDSLYLKNSDQSLVQVNLIEKLLLTLLIKISNFIPGGGIWMNTQRPEWNDANNALVGYGVSMVTLYYIRRYLKFLKDFLNESGTSSFEISEEVYHLFNGISSAVKEVEAEGEKKLSDKQRKQVVDKLGMTASNYRTKVYSLGFSGISKMLDKNSAFDFIESCLAVVDDTIEKNRREDGLYHSYNILSIKNDEMKISNLYEMLEGQVAVLSSGYLSTDQSIELLTALRNSRLYRPDQNSYILYPNKELPLFINKNNIKSEIVEKSKLLKSLIANDRTEIIYKDVNGNYHFQDDLINAEVLNQKLSELESNPEYVQLAAADRDLVLDIYEQTFGHKEFTGRATTFFKYEGLGSIYWHMVSKLLLAAQEVYFKAESQKIEPDKLEQLRNIYYDIKRGIGVEKAPDNYGAFPTDAYSHTPSFAGVQQPGMTGQVKEDIISRMHELGLFIRDGKIIINPSLLNFSEFLKSKDEFKYYELFGDEKELICPENCLVFTYCQIPFIYRISDRDQITVIKNDGEIMSTDGLVLNESLSQSIFNREGKVTKVEVMINRN